MEDTTDNSLNPDGATPVVVPGVIDPTPTGFPTGVPGPANEIPSDFRSGIFPADTTLNPDERAELAELRRLRDSRDIDREAVTADPTRTTFVGDRAMDRGNGGFVGNPDNIDVTDTDVVTERKWIARDYNTRHHYGGLVDPSLLEAFENQEDDHEWILATQRSVIIDRFGNTETVWVEAPVQELPGPIPGEYRRLFFEEIGV